MKTVIGGGSDYVLSAADYAFLEKTVRQECVSQIFTSGLPGVPQQVAIWARDRNIPVYAVTANFMHDGPATPEERNTSLVAMVRIVIAFPGETTDDLIAKARKARRRVVESPSRLLASPVDLRPGEIRRKAGTGLSP